VGEESAERDLGIVLVVDDDARLRKTLVRALAPRSQATLEARGVTDCLEVLGRGDIDLVLLDVRLRDGSGLDVVRAAADLSPMPAIVVISGSASPAESFALGRAGARAYLPKAELLDRLDELAELARRPPPLAPVSAWVGRRSIKEVTDEVRSRMLDAALALGEGSPSRAARHLGVSRQAVQQMLARRARRTG
jgi:two-component system response regulator RegA